MISKRRSPTANFFGSTSRGSTIRMCCKAGGKRFGLSDLAMENIVNVPQRPKTEILDGKLLSINHVLKIDSQGCLAYRPAESRAWPQLCHYRA